MDQFLRDSIWTFVGAIVAVIAIIVSVLIYLGQKQRKRLRVEKIAGVPLVRIGSQGIEGLVVAYKGKSLERASIVVASICNSGNTPIQTADFEAPISLKFEQDAELLEASVVETRPPGMPVSAEIKGTSAILSPHLLNPGDVVVMRILLASGGSKFKPFARIAGVHTIETRVATSLWPPILGLLGAIIAIAAFVLAPVSDSAKLVLRAEEIPYVVAATVGGLLMTGVLLRDFTARLTRIRDRMMLYA